MIIRASLSVASADPETVTRAVESMTRTATGLALEGVQVVVVVEPDEDEGTEDDQEERE
jgi:hypothetical protein